MHLTKFDCRWIDGLFTHSFGRYDLLSIVVAARIRSQTVSARFLVCFARIFHFCTPTASAVDMVSSGTTSLSANCGCCLDRGLAAPFRLSDSSFSLRFQAVCMFIGNGKLRLIFSFVVFLFRLLRLSFVSPSLSLPVSFQ